MGVISTYTARGLRDDLASMIGIDDDLVLPGFVRLLAMKKRKANKVPCPCGTGMRLGRCHNRKLNTLREKLGRRWFFVTTSLVALIGIEQSECRRPKAKFMGH
jgi:hypothetical protein